jgi:hypothetical protein
LFGGFTAREPIPFCTFSDVRVNWQVFKLDESDEQLLDLITSYGESLPKCDADGNEIVPPEEGQCKELDN